MAPNNEKKVKRKHVQLSVVQKLELVEKLEQGISAKDICNMYGIHRGTLSNIKKSKPKLQKFALTHNIDSSELHASTIGNKIRMNFGPNKNLDKALYEWYSQQRSSGINVQQHQLRSEFSALVTRMRLSIKHPTNWLCRFKKRHGIMGSLRDASCSESESEKKNSTEDKVIPEEPIKVENLPSSSSSPPTTSTSTKNFGESVKVENFSSEPCLSQTDVYQNYVWSEYDIKSEGSPSP